MRARESASWLVWNRLMKIGIIGAGALGSLIAFYLSAHADTWLLSRRRQASSALESETLADTH